MKMGRIELFSYILLGVGVALLIITFYMAFALLTADLDIISRSLDLSKAIGEILGPISEAIIRVMFLGVMGWIGSVATMRGIQLLREIKHIKERVSRFSQKEEKKEASAKLEHK